MATKLDLIEPARSRIVRLTNVNSTVLRRSVICFFYECNVLDQYRTVNTRTGHKSVIYVLFTTVAEKNFACRFNGRILHRRHVRIQPAPKGNYLLNDDETEFVETGPVKKTHKDAATDANTVEKEHPNFTASDFPALGAATEPQTPTSLPSPSIATSDATTNSAVAQHTAPAEMSLNPNDQAPSSPEFSESHYSSAEKSPLSSLDPDPRLFHPFYYQDPFSHPSQPRNPPPGFNTARPPTFTHWNLNGHDPKDRSKNVITPNDWYIFQKFEVAEILRKKIEGGTRAALIAYIQPDGTLKGPGKWVGKGLVPRVIDC